jgi:hypothetical protein
MLRMRVHMLHYCKLLKRNTVFQKKYCDPEIRA